MERASGKEDRDNMGKEEPCDTDALSKFRGFVPTLPATNCDQLLRLRCIWSRNNELEEEIKVTLASRKQKVQITSELLSALEEQEVHYKLN